MPSQSPTNSFNGDSSLVALVRLFLLLVTTFGQAAIIVMREYDGVSNPFASLSQQTPTGPDVTASVSPSTKWYAVFRGRSIGILSEM